MKKIILFLFLILFGLNSYSQDWMPFVLNQQNHFQHGNLVESILLDSTFTQNDTAFYYFNSKISNFGDCYEGLTSYDRRGEDPPSVKDEEGKTYTGLSLSKYFTGFHLVNDSLIYDSFIFKPFSKPGDFWSCNGVDFTCTLASDTTLFNETDSIKYFIANGNGFDNEQFILSKNYGFLKYTPFKNFTKNNPTLMTSLKLVGYSKGDISKGFSPPTINKIYDYNVGDIYISQVYYQGIDHSDEFVYYTVYIDDVTQVTHYNDSVKIKSKRNSMSFVINLEDSNSNHDTIYTESSEINTYRVNRYIKNPTGWCGYLNTSDYSDITMPKDVPRGGRIFTKDPYNLDISDNDTVVTVSFTNHILYGLDTCQITAMAHAGRATKFIYKTGLGLVYYDQARFYDFSITKYRLLGAKKKNMTYGSLSYLDYFEDYNTGIKQPVNIGVKIYPNPFKDKLFIEGKYIEISIYDITGNLVITAKDESKIDVSKLTKGIYIINCKSLNGNMSRSKFIKN